MIEQASTIITASDLVWRRVWRPSQEEAELIALLSAKALDTFSSEQALLWGARKSQW